MIKATFSSTVMDPSVQLLGAANHELLHCSSCKLVLDDPHQLICGDRICYSCMNRQEEKEPIKCLRCGIVTEHEQCHKDKACSKELQQLLVKCGSRGCEWIGKYSNSQMHKEECDHVVEICNYCGRKMTRVELREHLNLKNYNGCTLLPRPCTFTEFGCEFEGTTYQLDRHEHNERQYHYLLTKSYNA